MAKKLTKILQRSSAGDELTSVQEGDLLGGSNLLSGLDPVFSSESERRKCFLRHEKELLRRWVEKRPGARPDSWWRYAAKSPRLKVGEGSRPMPFPQIGRYKTYDLHEIDFQYLTRLSLFFDEDERVNAAVNEEILDALRRQEAALRSHAERVEKFPEKFVK